MIIAYVVSFITCICCDKYLEEEEDGEEIEIGRRFTSTKTLEN